MLDKIVSHTRRQLEAINLQTRCAMAEFDLGAAPSVRSLRQSLSEKNSVSIIAEIKRRSPSRGALTENLSVAHTAAAYERGGARAISVLTEQEFFHGSVADLQQANSSTRLPVLRKDFIIDEFQVRQSRRIGADAILLIAAILDPKELSHLHTLAREIGLEVLVEVHSAEEIEMALTADPEIIGINNRNLHTFTVDLQTTEILRPLIPDGIVCVSESGVRARKDIDRLAACGVDAALVGEALVTAADPETKVRDLAGTNDDQN